MRRYCNRCACCLPREEWDLCNCKTPVDTEAKVAACINCIERNQSSQRPIHRCTEWHSEVLDIRSVDPRFVGGNTGSHGSLYLDRELLQRYLKHTHSRMEQEVYVWMTTSEMGFPITQESGEVQCWWDIVFFLETVITDYIREVQDKSIGGEGSHMSLIST